MAVLSAYEQQRLDNIASNNAVLEALGLSSLGTSRLPLLKATPTKAKRVLVKKRTEPCPPETAHLRRKSPRLADGIEVLPFVGAADESQQSAVFGKPAVLEKPPDVFGEIEGFHVGYGWEMRAECCADLVHRATVAGIVGSAECGCYSIVLNGGYADDVDRGDVLTYTGSGGRSLKGTASNPKNLRTGPATHDQTLEGKEGRYNAALHKSWQMGLPVRVVRGYKLDSRWAPLGVDYGGTHNYRYDGLYRVERAWLAAGLEGYKVWKFALKRLAGQPELTVDEGSEAAGEEAVGGA
jgi:hypothetical protein